jgi:hypothetical protein
MKNIVQRKKEILRLNDPHILYLALLRKNSEVFIKIGITSQSFEKRFENEPYKATLINGFQHNGYVVRALESLILERLTDKYDRYQPKTKLNGYSECFPIQHLSNIESIFEEIENLNAISRMEVDEEKYLNKLCEKDLLWMDFDLDGFETYIKNMEY